MQHQLQPQQLLMVAMYKWMAHDWPFKNLLRTNIYIVIINILFLISFIHVDLGYHNQCEIEVKDLIVTYLSLPKCETTIVANRIKSLILSFKVLPSHGCWWRYPPLCATCQSLTRYKLSPKSMGMFNAVVVVMVMVIDFETIT